jgi:hypothetical protein
MPVASDLRAQSGNISEATNVIDLAVRDLRRILDHSTEHLSKSYLDSIRTAVDQVESASGEVDKAAETISELADIAESEET